MKTILRKYGIPTASFKVFDEYDEAEQYLLTTGCRGGQGGRTRGGEGVAVAQTYEEGIAFPEGCDGTACVRRRWGSASSIEECLPGEEGVRTSSSPTGKSSVRWHYSCAHNGRMGGGER